MTVTEIANNAFLGMAHPSEITIPESVTSIGKYAFGYCFYSHYYREFHELPDNINRRIFIFERASQFDLLSENADTFMWVSPVSQKKLDRYGLVQKKCIDNRKVYKDVLIFREGYKLSKLDKQFITELCESKRKYLK